jgi:hypothetical protein
MGATWLYVRFEVFTAVRMMMLFFWVLVEDGDSMFLRNVGIYRRVYTASKPRRIITQF